MGNDLRITQTESTPHETKVIVPQYLRDNDWAVSIGSIQKNLDGLASDQKGVAFDFSETRWIDPLPLLSLLIEITNLVKRGVAVQATFPTADNGSHASEINKPYQNSPNRLLLFLAKEGFFAELLEHNVTVYVGKEELSQEVINRCAILTATASYADAHFIPIRLFDVPILAPDHQSPDSNFPAVTVEKILCDAEVALRSRCSAPERRHLLYTLRAVLQEFLHNVQEHAYQTDGYHPAGLYVRYRQGKAALSNTPGHNFYEECIKLEIGNCAQLNRDWLDARLGCLEIFFIDRGIGITEKFASRAKKNDFRSIMHKTFHDGVSTKDYRRTERGGLYVLHTLMSRSYDYVRAICGKTWFGASVPFTRLPATVTKPIGAGNGLVGLAYHIRLSWKAPTDEKETWLRFTPEAKTQIRKVELCKSAASCSDWFSWYEKRMVVDDRFRNPEEFPGGSTTPFLMWLPKRGLMKWDILDKLEKLTSHISGKCTLIIADIPTMEAAMYQAAMSQSSFHKREGWPNKIGRIILATNRWTFAYAEYVDLENRHGFSSFRTEEIPETLFKPGLGMDLHGMSFRVFIIHWLKWHDSRRFWQEARKGERYFLPEKVIWSEKENHDPDKIIDGYLDFPATTHNHFCAELYRNALNRIFGLLDEYPDCLLVSVDRLADPVVHDVYANEVYDPPERDKPELKKVATGSVLVSGTTLHATGSTDENIHFFIHGSSEQLGKYPSLFHWMPEAISPDAAPSQKRIGKTSAIAPKGWLSIEIPRDDSGERIAGYRTPVECYEDWQNPGPVITKIGHWHYEGHHDFLTVNIPNAVEDAFIRNGPLAQFLTLNILHPLGVLKAQITGTGKEFPTSATSSPSILVYRSHPSSERIIDNVLETLSERDRLEIMKWIFPILPLRRRWGGSTLLIPPRMREEMLIALKTRKSAIIFDDAAISGRTVQDLLTSLRAWGAKDIQVVTIANRMRLPMETTKSIKYFWRLDVPTLGRQGTCPLCQALESAKSLVSQMIPSSAAYKSLQQWIRRWSQASPITEWDAGLSPLPLPQPQEKDFCYRQKEGRHLYKLKLYRSTGITIHAAEVHAMTASDDYALKKVRKLSDPAIQIELAASQLLLFGDELDMDLVRDFIIDGLLEPLVKLNDGSPYGQLAVLVLMRMLLSTESKQVREDIAHKVKERIDTLRALSHGQILMAYLITQELADVNDDMFHAGARLLTTRHSDIATKLRSLFRETVTPLGNIHSEPIPDILNKLEGGVTPNPELWSNALNSLAKLRDIIKELGLDLAASDNGSYKDKCSKLMQSLQCAESAIEKNMNPREHDQSESLITINTEAKDCLQQAQLNLNEVADCYFYRINLDEEHNPDKGHKAEEFVKVLSSIWDGKINWEEVCKAKKISFAPTIKLSSTSGMSNKFDGIKLTWLLWHAPLQMMIRDLLMNATHPASKIPDPWDKNNAGEAHMWVHVGFTPQAAIISIANGATDPASAYEEIKKGSQKKTRWDILTDLGGKIDYEVPLSQKEILAIQVHIPYAPYLRHRDATTGE